MENEFEYEYNKFLEDFQNLLEKKEENNSLSCKENLKIGLKKKNYLDNDVIKRDFSLKTEAQLNIEEYLYLDIGENEKIIFKKAFLEKNNFSEEKLWDIAEKNVENDYILSEMGSLMTILTNKKFQCGASALLSKKARKEICEKLGTNKILVLPSSIHEILIVDPLLYEKGENCIEKFTEMVKEVNQTQVALEEQLENKAFFVEL